MRTLAVILLVVLVAVGLAAAAVLTLDAAIGGGVDGFPQIDVFTF